MSQLSVVTPSFRYDEPLFRDLHCSVLAHTSDDTVHHVIVPPSDRDLFRQFEGPRCNVWAEDDVLPRRYLRTPRNGWWLNARQPWPPVRGWVLQQALKIAVAAELDTRVVLIADSDVVLIRPIDAATFTTDGQVGLVRRGGAVHEGMRRHVIWHSVARRLLGLLDSPDLPLPDYVSSFNVWEPPVLRALQRAISRRTGRSWLDGFTAELHVSEFILYGVFVDEVMSAAGGRPALPADMCHDYWDRNPLTAATASQFVAQLGNDAVAMMISAKSRTPLEIRRGAIRECESHAQRRGR